MDEILDSQKKIKKLLAENTERIKELACINQTTQILKEGKPIEDALLQICAILPRAWQYPDFTKARIMFDGKEFKTPGFKKTDWCQLQSFETIDDRKGQIEICYVKEFPVLDEGPFMHEERNLINNLSNIICGYINSQVARVILKKTKTPGETQKPASVKVEEKSISGRQLLQKYLNKQNYDRDIFHDLMLFKVREILLIANLYDAYNIEKEGHFAEYMLGEYYQLNLTSMPRVTGVSSAEEALGQLRTKHFDLIIFMMGVDKNAPAEISRQIKNEFGYIPIFLLINNNSDISLYETQPAK